jgi:hypothetical protein
MRKILSVFFLATALGFSNFSVSQMAFVPGEMLVQFDQSADPEKVLSAYTNFNGTDPGLALGNLLSGHMNIYKVHYNPVFRKFSALLDVMRSDEGISNAQLNHYVEKRDAVIPDDPEFTGQWHHLNTGQTGGLAGAHIGSTEAWEITTGGLTAQGDTIVVCVIEGGNLNHPDLQANAWVNNNEIPGDGIDNDGNGFVDDYLGWNVASNSDQGVLSGGHGTQVMGMIGAGGNNDLGVSGINWDVKIMSVAGESLGNEASVVSAYNYALVMRQLYDETDGALGAFVVATNASWGIDGGDINDVPIWNAFYDTLGVHGILNCGATANNNVDIDVVGDIPTGSTSDYMVSVTATNHNDLRTFSGYGLTTIDLAAPGGNVLTTSGQQGYGTTSGTSFASPLTAGVIALLYSVPCESFITLVKENPQLGADYVRYALMEGVDPIASLAGFTVTGGRVNAFNSLNILLDNCGAAVCLPPFSFNYAQTDDTVYAFNWNSIDPAGVSIRYRIQGEEEWTVVADVEGGTFVFDQPELCATYEFEIAAQCIGEGEELVFGSTRIFETLGCCIAPQGLDIPELNESTAVVTWINDFALENYVVFYREQGTAVWAPVGTFAEEQAMISGLDSCTVYEFLVQPDCAEGFDEGSILEFKTKGCGVCIDNEFCASLGESSFFEFINAVEIGEFESVTGNNGGYALFEESGMELMRVVQYEATVTPGFSGFSYPQFVRVWIDFNQDGVFTPQELVLSSTQGSPDVVSGLIDIPSDALLGSTRMRVAQKFVGTTSASVGACEVFEEGETEDYCITILDNTVSANNGVDQASFSLFPNPGNGVFNYTGLELGNGAATFIQVFDITGKMVLQERLNADRGQFDLTSFDNGLYLYSVVSMENNERLFSGKLVVNK